MFSQIINDYGDRESWHRSLVDLRRSLPLLAALIAPLSVLLDIPALSQPWYGSESKRITDDKVSLILSAFSFFFNLIANVLLMLRFSVKTDRAVTLATNWSIVFWILKPVIAIINLVIFGIYRKQTDGAVYLEGFWCAVVSCVLAALSALCLLINFGFEFNKRVRTLNKETRKKGRGFMINVTLFVSTLAVQALIFSRIEGWTYLSGIYFSTVTILTVGFGDLVPTQTSSKILLFPIVVIGVVHFATVVTGIISYFQSRTKLRHKTSRRKYRQKRLEMERAPDTPDLIAEMALLEDHQRQEERDAQIVDLFYSLLTFLTLWLIGAVIFSKLEGWTYGNSLYFASVFFLTIGFGDFAPKTSAGRVAFVIFAVISVPVITSFVVQTLSSSLDLMRGQWKTRKKIQQQPEKQPTPHAVLVRQASHEIHLKRSRSFAESKTSSKAELGSDLIDLMLKMDVQTKKLLNMTLSGHDKIVLRADIFVQARNSDQPHDIAARIFEAEDVSAELSNYRKLFAQAVATASALKGLTGEDRRAFERVAESYDGTEHWHDVDSSHDISIEFSSEGTRTITFLDP